MLKLDSYYFNIDKDLYFIVLHKDLLNEFNYFKITIPKKYSLVNRYNKLIRFFQQDVFYKKEKELWKNDDIKLKLINNRQKYLKIPYNEITTYDILTGFKKSGIYYGYSGFNPLLIKKFCIDNNIRILYDPCGGWGHRLLGCLNIEKYIYNDLSYETYNNVNDIINYFNIDNVVTYNNDCREFIPNENFDAIFTCPPYFNLEHYECGDFKTINDYNDFIESIISLYNNTKTCKILGLVLREDLICDNTYVNKILLTTNHAYHLNNNTNKNKEYLYIWKK